MGNNIDEWLPETRKPDILKLVIVFFFAKMLAATQDIAVDGWALTMLKKLVLSLTFLLFRISII
jgi:MFS transporter, PAT family, solute carrier family 33 (acetyl-CoA transportor), member 1